MKKVLFTRKLSWSEKIQCLNRGIVPVVKPMIKIEPVKLQYSEIELIISGKHPYFVFTSKNAVKYFIQSFEKVFPGISIVNVEFIVIGKKTGLMLERYSNKQHVFQYAGEKSFADYVAGIVDGKPYLYFCSDIAAVKWEWMAKHENAQIIDNYKTISTALKVDIDKYEKIVFMSSSAVNSFFQHNKQIQDNTTFYVIGEPTLQTLKAYFAGTIVKSPELRFDALIDCI